MKYKEDKYFVGYENYRGHAIYKIDKDGNKFYLSKLARNIKDSSWNSDYLYAKHWKNKSRAEEIVNILTLKRG